VTGAVAASGPSTRSRPFALLVRLFLARVFQGSGGLEESELDLGIGLILALLALPGAFYSLLLLEKYSTLLQWMHGQNELDPLAGALPDEYFFIVLSMVVTGVVAVWLWDNIFPDRRDYANLVPLPISLRTIFLANLTAILLLALLLAVDVNAASAVLFPLIVSASENTFTFFLHFVGIHAVVVVLASIFSFCAVFAVIGMLMLVLPYGSFRRISFYLRASILACLVAMLSTSFAVPSMLRLLPHTSARFLPPVWFLGLCQLLRGRATESLANIGRVALVVTVTTVIGGIFVYAFSYRRYFVRIPETADGTHVTNHDSGAWFFRIADRIFLRNSFQRAAYRFSIKTLLRSEHHGLVLGGFFGLGVVIACQFLFTSSSRSGIELHSEASPDLLAVPLALSYCVTLGLRFAFEIPSELRANWAFRLYVNEAALDCVALAQRVTLTFILPWVVVVVFPVYAHFWGWRTGIVHASVTALCSLLLTQILLRSFRKIPFTCSYPPFGQASVMVALLYVIGFFAFVLLTSHFEHWALPSLVGSAVLILALATVCAIVPRVGSSEETVQDKLVFDEGAPVAFELLDLRKGS
jgi:hypothetical protein